ncbi:alpha-L-arabinofuranosidase 1-like [Populus alba]|uniref:alpha-L-arabinofuranosidase 1-like n=1 Tax=Populus alba TaxID=43335 RepID=UPI003CC75F00
MGFTIFEASVSDYAVTGNDVGTGSLLAALADAGFLIGLKRNRESSGATLPDAKLQTNSSTLVASAITWQNSNLPENKVNFGNSEVNLKVSIDGLGLNSQLSGSTRTVLTSSNVMDENSFVDPIKVVPAQTMLENADKDIDVYSLHIL